MEHSANFWVNYFQLYMFLKKHYPNKLETQQLDNLGPLDRIHLSFALEKYDKLTHLSQRFKQDLGVILHIIPFFYGAGVMQNGLDELYDLEFKRPEFFNGDSHLVIFVLGIFTHWSLLIVAIDKLGSKTYAYVDSQNIDLQQILDQRYDDCYQFMVNRRQEMGKKPHIEKDKKEAYKYYEDLHNGLHILVNFMEGKKSLMAYLLERQIQEMLKVLTDYTKLNLAKSGDFIQEPSTMFTYYDPLYTWFDQEYRPQVIKNDILLPFNEHKHVLDQEDVQMLVRFEKFCRAVFSLERLDSQYDKKLLSDIGTFLDELKQSLHGFEVGK